MIAIRSFAALTLLSFLGLGLQQSGEKPPSSKEQKALVAECMQLGSRAMGAERVRQLAIFSRLSSMPGLDARQATKWRKNLIKAWERLPGLPETKGDNFYWEQQRRGRYIVAGKSKKARGLLIGMHGGGVGTGDAGVCASLYGSAASGLKWTAIFPEVLEKTERGWTDSGTEEWIWDLVEQARRSFGIDADHVYLAGHSMGGYGSWTLGAHHADRVAALAPSAGAPSPILDRATDRIVSIDWGVVPNLRNVPMVVYQSIDDPQVPPDANQFAVGEVESARKRFGGFEDFKYWEVDGRGHGAPPGGAKAHLEMIEGFTRQSQQDVVVWQPALDWKRQFYWLFWEQPSIGAQVVGRIDRESNTVAVELTVHSQSQPGSGLAVLLDDRLVDWEREVVVTLNGEEVFRGTPERRLEVLLDTSTSGDPGRQYSSKIPLR